MINSSLINILKSFNSKEMKEFREFVSSPFFNTNENVVKLFNVIKKYYPAFNSNNLDKKKIFCKIYTGEKYKDSKMRLLIFYLNDLAEKFLVNRCVSDDQLAFKVFLLDELKKRKLPDSFEKTLNETYKKLNAVNVKNPGYFTHKYNIDIHSLNYFKEFHSFRKNKAVHNNPEEIFRNISNFHMLAGLNLYEVLLTDNYLYKKDFNPGIFEKVINEFDKNEYSCYPEILCRYYLCMLWRDQSDESNYYELKHILEIQGEKISPEALNASYVGLKNYCTLKIRTGEIKFLGELFELFKKDLENKFYLEEGFMTQMFYRNAVVLGAMLKEFDWTRNFIEQYCHELREKVKEPVYLYSLAFVETEQRNFEKALKYISSIKTEVIYLKVDVRILQSRIFFEMNWQEQLSSLVDASKHFLVNNKTLPAAQKEFYSGFFKYIYRLSQYKNSGNTQKMGFLKSEIEDNDNLHGKEWLLMKINEDQNKKGAV